MAPPHQFQSHGSEALRRRLSSVVSAKRPNVAGFASLTMSPMWAGIAGTVVNNGTSFEVAISVHDTVYNTDFASALVPYDATDTQRSIPYKKRGMVITVYIPNPSPSVFRTTKNNHNILQGVADPKLRLTREQKDNFDAWILKNSLRWTAPGGPLAPGGVEIAFIAGLTPASGGWQLRGMPVTDCLDIESAHTDLEVVCKDDAFNLSTSFLPDDTYSTFPFDKDSPEFTNIPQFVTNLSVFNNEDHKPWITHVPDNVDKEYPWMVSQIGNDQLTPDKSAGETVEKQTNPRWRWRDVWRPLNLYKVLLNQKAAENRGSGLVLHEFLSGLPDGDLTTALYPKDIKDLLIKNEKAIVASKRNWVGFPTNATRPKQYPMFPDVKVTHAAGTSVLAGINWKTLSADIRAAKDETNIHWTGAIVLENKGKDQHIEERKGWANQPRKMGWLSKIPTIPANSGDPDAGFYLVADGIKDKNKIVFVFAAHLIDQHSRVFVKNTKLLRNLPYATPYAPGTKTPPQIVYTKAGTDVRYYAHAHSAVMAYTDWMNWVGQVLKPGQTKGERMPT
ncbi:hypothetical protein BC835DRAFT_1524570 [Cytidiella melzeri]|nr:hypothetical protein BC835DRAFT_1524570 [Cytidiella melzeri]